MSLSEKVNYFRRWKQLADAKYGAFSRFFQFCLVGGTGMIVDLTLYALLLALKIPLIYARGAAIWAAMTYNFWLNRRVTFNYSRDLPVFKQYVKFCCSCGLGALLSWLVAVGLTFGTTFFNHHVFLAAIIGIVIGTLSNFALSLLWVFQHKGVSLTVASDDDRQTDSPLPANNRHRENR